MIDFEALLKRLEDAELGKTGVTLTINTMPISVTKGICLRSNISGDEINYEIPGLGRGQYRIITRASSAAASKQLLLKAIEALGVNGQIENIGSMRVRYNRPITTPMTFPVSEGNLRESSVNMKICYEFDTSEYPWLDPHSK